MALDDMIREKIFYAIQDAVQGGWSVDKFLNEASECWEQAQREEAEHSRKTWANAKEGAKR